MKKILGIAAIMALAGSAQGAGQVVISEILGSTGGSDAEFVEIANIGDAAVDITGWSVEFWDSNDSPNLGGTSGSWGTLDGGSPYAVTGNVTLQPGELYVWGNSLAAPPFGDYAAPFPTTFNGSPFVFNELFQDNAIENSSYTAILSDAADTTGAIIDSWFVLDNPALDEANRGGVALAPNFSAGPDGTFLPPGAYRDFSDDSMNFLNFGRAGTGAPDLNDGTAAGGTPGILIPTPGAFALLGIGGLVAGRRRRA